MNTLTITITENWQAFRARFRLNWSLIKSLQTFLLLITGVAGFISSRCPWLNFPAVVGVAGSMFLAISGSTALNMWYDKDIDAKMKRTAWRPIPSGQVSPRQALLLGLALSILGVGWALTLDRMYGIIILAGTFIDVVVYTIWLKRRSAWAIVWGGISGGMPILAGRCFGVGEVEWVGVTLALSVLFWIPTHILTFNIRHYDDYFRAGIPTIPSVYGIPATQRMIAGSSIAAAAAMGAAAVGIGMEIGFLRLMLVLSIGLLTLAIGCMVQPSEKANFGLFKYASLYMLGSMLLIAAGVF